MPASNKDGAEASSKFFVDGAGATSEPNDGAEATSKPIDGAEASSNFRDGAEATSKPNDGAEASSNFFKDGAEATSKPNDGAEASSNFFTDLPHLVTNTKREPDHTTTRTRRGEVVRPSFCSSFIEPLEPG